MGQNIEEDNLTYHIKTRTGEGGEIIAYLEEMPTTSAYGKDKVKAITNLLFLLHGERDNPTLKNSKPP